MRRLNTRMVAPTKGLLNAGARCYFNALLQALGSCSALHEELVREPAVRSSPTAALLLEFFQSNEPHQHLALFERMVVDLTERRELLQPLYGQQCAGEAFTLLMTAMESLPSIQNLFLHRYRSSIQCGRCGHRTAPTEQKNNLFTIPGSVRHIESYMYHNTEQLTGYRCESCHATDTNTLRENRLVLIPEILVMMFQKDHESAAVATDVPAQLTFQKFQYRPVAYIQHYGSPSGGHYDCYALRGETHWLCFDDEQVTAVGDGRAPPIDKRHTYLVIYHLE